MRNLILFISILFSLNNYAQHPRNLVIVSGNNEPVQIMINNRLINEQALKDIRITGLNENYYDVNIRFTHQPRVNMSATLYVPPLSEIVYEIFPPDRRNMRGEFIIKTIYPLDNQIPYYQPDLVFPFGENATVANGGQSGTGTVQQSGQINININNNNAANNQGASTPVVYVPGYQGEVGCSPPVTPERFENMLHTIENQSFESSKFNIAKQIIKHNDCMTVNQLVQILRLFDFDDTKLRLSKYAYHYIYDIENYYKVYNVFVFKSNKDKLANYLESMD